MSHKFEYISDFGIFWALRFVQIGINSHLTAFHCIQVP